VNLLDPPTCKTCAKKYIGKETADLVKTCLIGAALFVVGLVLGMHNGAGSGISTGIILMAIPFGWRVGAILPLFIFGTNPAAVVVVGIIKLSLAIIIGVPSLLIYTIKTIIRIGRLRGVVNAVK
jgi:hypothetical protein